MRIPCRKGGFGKSVGIDRILLMRFLNVCLKMEADVFLLYSQMINGIYLIEIGD